MTTPDNPQSWQAGYTKPVAPTAQPAKKQATPNPLLPEAQKLLKVKVDGINGPETIAAVKAFQAKRGLTVDGVVGPQTIAALRSGGSFAMTESAAPVTNKALLYVGFAVVAVLIYMGRDK